MANEEKDDVKTNFYVKCFQFPVVQEVFDKLVNSFPIFQSLFMSFNVSSRLTCSGIYCLHLIIFKNEPANLNQVLQM